MTNNLDESAAQVVAAVQSGKLTQAAADNLRTWLTQPQYAAYFPRLSQLIAGGSWSILQDSFWERIPFGTAGRRGPMGELGTATMNERTIAESAHGVAVHVKQSLPTEWHRAVIGHDTRNRSQEFARITASVFAAHGIKTFLFPSHRSTPELSFAVRQLKCGTGVMITASHNPPADNGFKVYSQTGGQVLDDEATRITAAVNSAVNIPTVDLLTALGDGRVELVGEEIDSPFIRAVIDHSLSDQRDVIALFSPCHGVGETSVYRAVLEAGFTQVKIHPFQRLPDGNFPFAPDHFPNPERKVVLEALVSVAKAINADLILASDPDADRVGLSSRAADGSYTIINGNRTGILLADYLLRKRRAVGSLSPRHYVATTLVSSPMIEPIAQSQGVRCIRDLLTGFKYIAEVMDREGPDQFVFGFEESIGFLSGTHVRDKDATIASLHLLELAAELKSNGKTLLDRLDELFVEHGYFCDGQLSKTCTGETGRQQIQKLSETFRSTPPATVGPARLTRVEDYKQHEVRTLPDNRVVGQIQQPTGDVVIFDGIADLPGATTGIRIAARPSGTEPKIKFYLFAHPAEGSRDQLPLTELKKVREEVLMSVQNALSKWIDVTVA
ncbi:MAG: phospho-sugar mutase [Planctomycetes bacterium]|nr:phospho-sugar mutase [Planctomycetota bacterium]